MPEIIVNINISTQDILQYYTGAVRNVSAMSIDGKRVQFPINILRPFITHTGINGRFIIAYSEKGKLQEISKI